MRSLEAGALAHTEELAGRSGIQSCPARGVRLQMELPSRLAASCATPAQSLLCSPLGIGQKVPDLAILPWGMGDPSPLFWPPEGSRGAELLGVACSVLDTVLSGSQSPCLQEGASFSGGALFPSDMQPAA